MSNRTRNILLAIYIVAFSTLVVGATYAFFTVIRVSKVSPTVDIETANLNFISFTSGNEIYANPTIDNFNEGMGNMVFDTFASVYLKKEKGSEETKVIYNVYLEIEKNNFTYSTTEQTAELLIRVFDPNGNEVKAIDGLDYVTVTDGLGESVSGFDITTKQGRHYIESNRLLTTTTEINEIWNFEAIYVNLSESQNQNLNKEMKALIRLESVLEDGTTK